jgi:hypothetical protein
MENKHQNEEYFLITQGFGGLTVFLVERGEEVLDLLPEEPGGLLVRAAAGRHNLPPCAPHNPSITQIYPNVELFTI